MKIPSGDGMNPLQSLLQVLPNSEPLNVKFLSYLFVTRAVAVPWFLTQGEVSTLYLRNVSITAVLTIVHIVLAHLPPIVRLPCGVRTIHHGVIHASFQLHFRSRLHKVIVMRAQALDPLRPVVSPMRFNPQTDPR